MSRTVRLIAGIALGLIITVALQAKEKKVKPADLPPAVQSAVDQETSGAKVSGYTKETVEGETLYRASLYANRRPRVITIAADGTVISIDDRITWESIPVDVQTALTTAADKGSLGDFHSVSANGKIVSYNAKVERKGNWDRVSVKPHEATALEPIPSAPPASDKK
jgi:hypothetical protein